MNRLQVLLVVLLWRWFKISPNLLCDPVGFIQRLRSRAMDRKRQMVIEKNHHEE